MERPDPDARQPADFDRVFAEMTADWHPETAEDPPHDPAPSPSSPSAPPPRSAWAEDHPLFRHVEEPVAEEQDADPGHFDRPEIAPIRWRELSGVSVVGALLVASTVVVLLLVLVGARFPAVVGYGAVMAFVVGFVLLMTRLRRQGDDEPGGGARL
ncbi:hypothetical protein [Auraticoccus monumenti]|uniref:Uncharacterized protein n=1 Tax=Auraticoccus monumenti TaxID=675864 RepID=A0A1G7DS78_9ACTN|nr:hypothetical protein [Auraticoccus monumenti]SDE54394.1 hypothetical protein SAMN04489747_3696 [Auraticoccus monumenti]